MEPRAALSSWPVFWAKLTPVAISLLRELYVHFNGDIAKAKETLVHIRDHGARLRAKELELDQRLDRAEGKPPQ